jgi:thiamine-phosphate pyrophosphorylase
MAGVEEEYSGGGAVSFRDKLRGYYAILDANDEFLLRRLLTAAQVVQVRMKHGTGPGISQASRMARRLTASSGALLVVNDHVDIALGVGADGVHLGQSDLPPAGVRSRLPRDFLLGVSAHDLDQVRRAVESGADYIGYGPVYPTTTKENPDPVQGLEALRRAVEAAGEVPVVAIGGITPQRAAEVAATGVAAACAISAVNQARDPASAARQIAVAFRRRP